jgi:hypothetical protein
VLVLSFHLLYLLIIFSVVISISSSSECPFIDVIRYRDHSSSVMSDGPSFPSSILWALIVSAPKPIFLMTSGVASGVFSACRKCLMFLCSINLSIVGPPVMTRYYNSIPSVGSGISIDDIPPGQFIFDGSSDIICFVSFALLNICAALFASISGFIATNAASCSSSIDVSWFCFLLLVFCSSSVLLLILLLLLRLYLVVVLFVSLEEIAFALSVLASSECNCVRLF